MKPLVELIADRKALTKQIDALLNKAKEDGNREFTAEENQRFEDLMNEVHDLDGKIETARRVEDMNGRTQQLETHLQTVDDGAARDDLGGGGEGGGLSRQERRDLQGYSFLRAIRMRCGGQQLDGIEGEMHQEALREAQQNGTSLNGLGIPQVVLFGSGVRRFRDDLTAETATEGTETVATEVRPLIDHLHERLAVRQMGATFLSDLRGNIQFPRATAGTDPAHKDENATADETSPTFDTVTLSPERLPVAVEVSTQLLRQSSISVENWIRQYIATRIAIIMDKHAINGSGASHQPLGVLNVAGIGSVETDSDANKADKPTYEDIVDLETEVAIDNADMGALGYLAPPVMRGVLKKTLEFPSAPGGRPIWTGSRENGELNGYRAIASNVVPSNLSKGTVPNPLSAIIFGNWAELLIGQWGGLDILANPYSLDKEGLIRLTAHMFYDCAVRHAQSFAAIVDANTVDMA